MGRWEGHKVNFHSILMILIRFTLRGYSQTLREGDQMRNDKRTHSRRVRHTKAHTFRSANGKIYFKIQTI